MNRLIILGCIIFVIAFATEWLVMDVNPDPELEDLKRNDPDRYMRNAVIRQFADTGKLHHELSANRFTHFPLTDVTTLEQPNLMLYPDDGFPWSVTASNGRLLTKSTFREAAVELWDDVIMSRQDPDGQYLNIQTQSLTVYPDREFAETDRKVSISDNASSTSASGMEAHIDQGRLVFLSTHDEPVSTVFMHTVH